MPKMVTEKDKEILSTIKTIPLRYPYANFSELCKIADNKIRYLAANQTLSDELSAEYGLDPMRLPEFTVARWMASRHIEKRIRELGYSYASIAEMTDIDKSLLTKYMGGERPFGTVDMLQPLCYGVLHESAHKTMHGEEGRIRLPQIFSMIAKEMLTMPDDRIELLLSMAKRKKTSLFVKTGHMEEYKRHRVQNDVLRERLEEFAKESSRPTTLMFGPPMSNPSALRLAVYCLFTDEERKESYVLKLSTLQYICLITGQALDYWVCENYCAGYCPVYFDNGTCLERLTDKRILNFIGICSMLPGEEKDDLIALALSHIFLNEFEKTRVPVKNDASADKLPYSAFGLLLDGETRDGLFNRELMSEDM